MNLGNSPTLIARTDFIFVAANNQTTFTGADRTGLVMSYDVNNFDVWANGSLLTRADFALADGGKLVLVDARALNDVIVIRSYGQLSSIDSLLPGKQNVSTSGYLSSFRNKLINGNFDIWQRAAAQTVSGYGSDDRWNNLNVGSTKVSSQQPHVLGQTNVPGNPKFFSRTVVTSVAGASNLVSKFQLIEGVQTLSGRTATLTFYAKADAAKNIAVEFVQSFGTGGSPSSSVTGISSQLVALTTAWTRYNIVLTLPSIAGKTLGINGDDSLAVNFWFDAGSTSAVRAASLGQQSGTFDLSSVSLVHGDATADLDPFSPRHIQQELALCQRYFEKSYEVNVPLGSNTTMASGCYFGISYSTSNFYDLGKVYFKVIKRTIPTISYWSINGVAGQLYNNDVATNQGNSAVQLISSYGMSLYCVNSNMTVGNSFGCHWAASSEL